MLALPLMDRPATVSWELTTHRAVLLAARHAVIHVAQGRIVEVTPRRFPKRVSRAGLALHAAWFHRRQPGDAMWLYYNQPRAAGNYLSIGYTVTASQTSLRTIRTALATLDEIAVLKGVDGAVCDAANGRLSETVLSRFGWSPLPHRLWSRPFIRRYAPEFTNLANEHG